MRRKRGFDELLDQVQDRVTFDVIRDLAYPLPATVIGRLLGVPSGDLDALKTWSDAIAGSFTWAPDTMLAAHAAFVELTDYMVICSGTFTILQPRPRIPRHSCNAYPITCTRSCRATTASAFA